MPGGLPLSSEEAPNLPLPNLPLPNLPKAEMEYCVQQAFEGDKLPLRGLESRDMTPPLSTPSGTRPDVRMPEEETSPSGADDQGQDTTSDPKAIEAILHAPLCGGNDEVIPKIPPTRRVARRQIDSKRTGAAIVAPADATVSFHFQYFFACVIILLSTQMTAVPTPKVNIAEPIEERAELFSRESVGGDVVFNMEAMVSRSRPMI